MQNQYVLHTLPKWLSHRSGKLFCKTTQGEVVSDDQLISHQLSTSPSARKGIFQTYLKHMVAVYFRLFDTLV